LERRVQHGPTNNAPTRIGPAAMAVRRRMLRPGAAGACDGVGEAGRVDGSALICVFLYCGLIKL
jgi:hypothetical protein